MTEARGTQTDPPAGARGEARLVLKIVTFPNKVQSQASGNKPAAGEERSEGLGDGGERVSLD